MSKTRELRRWIAMKAVDIANGLDFSGQEPKQLMALLWHSFDDLERLKKKASDKDAILQEFPFLKDNPEFLEIALWEQRKALLWCYAFILGIHYAIVREAHRRMSKNKVNLYFGLLKLGHSQGDRKTMENAHGNLRRILLSIRKNHPSWFHFDDVAGWIGVIDEAIAEQLKKSSELDQASIFERMLENGFAVVYTACENRMTDEVRKLAQQPKVQYLGGVRDVTRLFEFIPAPPDKPEESLQRKAASSLVKELSRGRRGGGISEILNEIARFMEEPDQIRDGTEKQIHSRFVENVAQTRGVSKEQARRDLRAFKVRVREDKGLQSVVKEIRGLGPERQRLKIGVKAVPPADGDTEERN
jgi:hypothetical protein